MLCLTCFQFRFNVNPKRAVSSMTNYDVKVGIKLWLRGRLVITLASSRLNVSRRFDKFCILMLKRGTKVVQLAQLQVINRFNTDA